MEKLFKLLPDFIIEGKTTKLAVSALIIDTVLAIVLILILGGGTLSKDTLTIVGSHPIVNYVAGTIYLVFFFVIWFVLYIQAIKENEDGFSEIRQKLVGTWILNYTSVSRNDGPFTPARYTVGCSISISPDTRKLEFRFQTKDDPIYADGADTVSIVALRRDVESTYNLFYYFEGKRKLQQRFADHIEWEVDHRDDQLPIEFLGLVKFDAQQNMIQVQTMKGSWYDLNGNITRAINLLSELKQAANMQAELPKKRLSELEGATVGARVGEVEFTRGA
jgi:hypothetical protein